jgi:hypothetical protein
MITCFSFFFLKTSHTRDGDDVYDVRFYRGKMQWPWSWECYGDGHVDIDEVGDDCDGGDIVIEGGHDNQADFDACDVFEMAMIPHDGVMPVMA